MKLRLYSILQSACALALAALLCTVRRVQALRDWAVTRSTAENLKTCAKRQASRTRFS